jgi:hypothetical protein
MLNWHEFSLKIELLPASALQEYLIFLKVKPKIDCLQALLCSLLVERECFK